MSRASLPVVPADVFGFLEPSLPGVGRTRSGKQGRRLLLLAIVERINSVEIPLPYGERAPRINPDAMTIVDLMAAVVGRVRLALERGVDLGLFFEVDEGRALAPALHLSMMWHEHTQGRKFDGTLSLPGYVNLIEMIGAPPITSTNTVKWFRQALLRRERRIVDYAAHCMEAVGTDGSPIVSTAVLSSRTRQLERQKEYAKKHQMVSEDVDGNRLCIPFGDPDAIAMHRYAKTYIRLKGLEQFGIQQGLAGFFLTLTLRPSFHPKPSNGRQSWDGSTPREGHDEMQRLWRLFQRRFGKTLGVRVEEPHLDGCIHWHLLIFIPAWREDELRSCIADHFGGQIAAKVVVIDRSVGTGASYLTKYLQPLIPASRTPSDGPDQMEEKQGGDKPARYDAHRATWGGRAIQIFDIPGSSTIWDEMRRIKPGSSQHAELSDEAMLLHGAACSGDYCVFLTVLSEMRAREGIHVLYDLRPSGTKYVKGVTVDCEDIETRTRSWRVEALVPSAFKPRKAGLDSYA